MKEAGLYCKNSIKYKHKPRNKNVWHAPNLKKQLGAPTHINQLWSTDITYIKVIEGWIFVCVIMDEYSRKIIGWSIARHMRVELVLAALQMALRSRDYIASELIIHSERGSQYTSKAYLSMLKAHGLKVSMSGKGYCYDNAMVERFFRTLKDENTRYENLQSYQQLSAQLGRWIELDYNLTRHHSAIGYLAPMKFEKQQCVSLGR